MSMYHPKMVEFKRTFQRMFNEVDRDIEARFGDRYSLHPSRPRHGTTSDPSSDGLFNIGADFTPGYGSRYGRGYLIDVHMATLAEVPDDERWEIVQAVVEKLEELLPKYFPDRNLEIFCEGDHFKISGDFSLGRV